jgi:hypothetical protein
MLSDHERSMLRSIEHGLYDEDPEFARAFRLGRSPRIRPPRHWPSLLLTAAGLAMIVIGLVGRLAPLVVEGMVVAVAGFGYGRWQARLAKDRPSRRARRARWRHT